MSYNPDAIIYETQVVISNNSQLGGSTSGSLINEGTLSTKDTFITGQTVINNVNITPNANDIIYERQATLVNDRNSYTDIPDFSFDNSITTSFKAIINVTVSAGNALHAVWEMNGLYKPSGWVITSSFTGDITGVLFSMRDDSGIGKIQYTNANTSGTTIVRFRANTTAPPGTNPFGTSVGVVLNTSGSLIPNSLIYANGTDSLASTDITYNSNVFSIGGVSRIVAERATSFVNFSNGGAITSMGDTSIAKNLIVGEKIGISTTSPGYTLDVNGDLNFNGALYQNGSAYKSSQWTSTGNNISYTTGSVLTTDITTGNLNFTGDIYKNGVLYSGSAWITGTDGSLSFTNGNLIASTLNAQNAVFTNSSLGSATINDFVNLRTDNLNLGIANMYSGSFTANNNVTTPTNITGLAFDNTTIRSFNATVTITVLKSTNQNLYESYTLDGFQTDNGWNLYSSYLGDQSGLAFTISNTGQVKYTSVDHTIDWISTTLRFNVSTINNQEGYSQVDFNTSGTYTIAGITAGNINFTGALYQNGSPFLGSSQWNNTIGDGISFTSGNVVVRNLTNTNISSSSLNVTGITAGSINFTSDIYKNGVLYSGSQWLTTAGNISYTSGTVNTPGVVATTMTTGSLKATTTISTGTLAATHAAITNITANTLRLSNGTISNLLTTNVTSGSAFIDKLNATTLTTGALISGNANVTTLTVGNALFSTVASSFISSNVITAGSISISGDLSVGGTLTTVNITTTNLTDINISTGTLNASSSTISNVLFTNISSSTLIVSNEKAINISVGTLIADTLDVQYGLNVPYGLSAFGNVTATNIMSSLYNLNSTNGNYALGITDGNIYFTNPLSGYIWYENSTVANMRLTNGNLTVTGDITGFGNLSDVRLKTNIIDIAQSKSLEVVNALRPVTFNWKDDIFNESKRGTADAGFIAQEVEEIIPCAVSDYTTSDVNYKHIKFERMLPYLVGSIQKLTRENDDLRNRLTQIELLLEE